MRRFFIGFTAVFLTACASSPIQTMPLKQAVQFGSDLYYTTPNYAFDSTTRIEEVRLDAPESSELQSFGEAANRLIRRLSFDISGVIDTPNKLYQMTPTYHYKAKNMQASLSIPMVYDANQQSFLADLSAFDVFLSKAEHVDKYSRFDVGSYGVNDKGEKLIGIIQKYTRKNYEDMDNAVFSELPLTSEDRRMNVVRKIQVSDSLKKEALYSTDMMKEIFKIMRPTSNNEVLESDEVRPAELAPSITDEFRADEYEAARDKASEWLDPNSRHTSVLSFDRQGRIVQSQLLFDVGFNAPKKEESSANAGKGMHMKMSSTFNMTSIGQAKLVNPPTRDNTVDGFENLKGSLAGKMFGKLFAPKKHGDDEEAEIDAEAVNEADDIKPMPKSKRR